MPDSIATRLRREQGLRGTFNNGFAVCVTCSDVEAQDVDHVLNKVSSRCCAAVEDEFVEDSRWPHCARRSPPPPSCRRSRRAAPRRLARTRRGCCPPRRARGRQRRPAAARHPGAPPHRRAPRPTPRQRRSRAARRDGVLRRRVVLVIPLGEDDLRRALRGVGRFRARPGTAETPGSPAVLLRRPADFERRGAQGVAGEHAQGERLATEPKEREAVRQYRHELG